MDAEQGHVGVRAAVHALDAALAEHRRGLALAASRRERERMARGREVKAAARASERELEQPVERPMRALQLAETWVEVDRFRYRLTAGVRAAVVGDELRVWDDGWSARLALAPGEGPAAAAREAAARTEAAGVAAAARARARLERVIEASADHAATCHTAAATLAALDLELADRHGDHARVESCVTELAERLGPRKLGEPAEVAAARDRLARARAHLAAASEQPYAWIAGFPSSVAGAMLRDLPADSLEPARPAVQRLAAALGDSEPLLALAAGLASVVAVTGGRVLLATESAAEPHVAEDTEIESGSLRVAGREVAASLAEQRPGRLAAVLELLRAAGAAGRPQAPTEPPGAEDPVELLRRLGELHERGVLTAGEFATKKAELLRRI